MDHLDNMAVLKAATERMETILCGVDCADDNCNAILTAKDMMSNLARLQNSASKCLGHGHHSHVVEEDHDNVFVSDTWGLGKEDATCPAARKSDPMMLVLASKPLILKTCDAGMDLLHCQEEPNKSPNLLEDLDKETEHPVICKVESMKGMADVMDKEICHFAEHCLQAWWQEKQEMKMKRLMQEEPGTLFTVLDHKSKTNQFKNLKA